MAKKKKHWSAILKVLNACRGGRRYARHKISLATAWRDCKFGNWMQWLAQEISFLHSPRMMWGRKDNYATTDKAGRYWGKTANMKEKEKADFIRKLWPKPPRIPKKLLKDAGLL